MNSIQSASFFNATLPSNMSNASCNLPLNTDTLGLICMYGIIFAIGLPSNLLSFWGLYHLGRSGGGGCQKVYILNLLLSDLLQILTLPLWILYLRDGHRWPYGQITCDLVGYVFYVNVYVSIMFLCLIALDRYLAIVYPFSSRRVRTVRVAVIMGIAVWVLTFVFCLCGLLPSVFDEERLLCLERYRVTLRFACFRIATVVLGFLLPCGILGYTSVHIGLALKRSPSLSAHECRKIVGILVLITLNFIVVFGPYHLVGGYRFISLLVVDEPCQLEHSVFLASRLCYGLTSLNTLLDPLFYIFMTADARSELQKSLSCWKRRANTNMKNQRIPTISHTQRSTGQNPTCNPT